MDEAERGRRNALRKEPRICAVMNVLMGAILFWIVFGWNRSTTAALAFDFLPQTMGMTLSGGMVVSMMCVSRIEQGKLVPGGPVPSRLALAIRVIGCAIAASLMFGGAASLALTALAPADLSPGVALGLKALYGVGMAFVTTPPILRMALGLPFWPRPARA